MIMEDFSALSDDTLGNIRGAYRVWNFIDQLEMIVLDYAVEIECRKVRLHPVI